MLPIPKIILVLTYWPLKSGLVQAYTLPYLRQMAEVIGPAGRIVLVTLDPAAGPLSLKDSDPLQETLSASRIEWVSFAYHRFGLQALLCQGFNIARLLWLCNRKRVSVIHCFCTPAGALGWLLSVLTGLPLVIDSYEPHAEAMVENGSWSAKSLRYRLLIGLEKLQSRRASAVIAVTESMREYARSRYEAEFKSFFVKPACVDLTRFNREGLETTTLRQELGLDGKIVAVYAGKVGGIYLDREIFELFKAARDRWGDRFRALFLSSDSQEALHRLSALAGFDPGSLIHRFVEHRDIPRYLALADFAITPVRPLPCKRHCAPIKDGEYWAMGLPVIITDGIADDSDIIERNGVGVVLREFTPAAYAQALEALDSTLLSQPQRALRGRIREVAVRYRGYERSRKVYEAIYGVTGQAPTSSNPGG